MAPVRLLHARLRPLANPSAFRALPGCVNDTRNELLLHTVAPFTHRYFFLLSLTLELEPRAYPPVSGEARFAPGIYTSSMYIPRTRDHVTYRQCAYLGH